MTTEQTEPRTVPRRLRRRSDERVIAGVASGLGDYFNVDPLLIRIALVASIVFGGVGIFLYLAAWLLVPDDTTERSIAERLLGRAGLAGGLFGGVVVVIGAIVFLGILGNIAGSSDGVFGLGFALLVIAVGAILLRNRDSDVVAATADASAAPSVGTEPAPRVVVRRPPRPPSPLGWYVLGAVLVGIGLLALVANMTALAVAPAHYFGLALGIIGIGLVVGTWWGHARWLIVIGLLLLPFAWGASLIAMPLDGSWGSHRFVPTTADEVRDEYRVAGGELVLDLTRLDPGDEPLVVDASVAMGELTVLLPDDAGGEINASVGGGRIRILDAFENGTTIESRYDLEGDGPQFALDLEAGLGEIRVDTRPSEGR